MFSLFRIKRGPSAHQDLSSFGRFSGLSHELAEIDLVMLPIRPTPPFPESTFLRLFLLSLLLLLLVRPRKEKEKLVIAFLLLPPLRVWVPILIILLHPSLFLPLCFLIVYVVVLSGPCVREKNLSSASGNLFALRAQPRANYPSVTKERKEMGRSSGLRTQRFRGHLREARKRFRTKFVRIFFPLLVLMVWNKKTFAILGEQRYNFERFLFASRKKT